VLLPSQPETRADRCSRLVGTKGGIAVNEVVAVPLPFGVEAVRVARCSSGYPDAAVKAWRPIGGTTDVRRWMLAQALLAPNPHDRQSWIADLRRESEITLVCDGDHQLLQTDPFERQILIGCGAFVELAVIATAERGYRLRVCPMQMRWHWRSG
jgi:hypothetical protein